MRVKEQSEKAGLKLNTQKTKIMASGPITSWQTEVEKCKQWKILFSWAPKITADGDCSHEMKRHLLLGKKAMTNLDSVFKSRDITLPTKVCILKAMVLSVVMYGCENWTAKKAEHQKIDAFELWCWRRLLRVPWAWKEIKPVNPKGNQSWIFTGRTVAEVLILWPLDVKSRFTGTDPEAGKFGGKRRRREQRMRRLDSITYLMDTKMSKLMSVELVRPSNRLILCHPLLLLSWGYIELDTT